MPKIKWSPSRIDWTVATSEVAFEVCQLYVLVAVLTTLGDRNDVVVRVDIGLG